MVFTLCIIYCTKAKKVWMQTPKRKWGTCVSFKKTQYMEPHKISSQHLLSSTTKQRRSRFGETRTSDICVCSSVCRSLMRSTNITDAVCPPRMEAALGIDPSRTKRVKKGNSNLEVPWAARLWSVFIMCQWRSVGGETRHWRSITSQKACSMTTWRSRGPLGLDPPGPPCSRTAAQMSAGHWRRPGATVCEAPKAFHSGIILSNAAVLSRQGLSGNKQAPFLWLGYEGASLTWASNEFPIFKKKKKNHFNAWSLRHTATIWESNPP